MMPSVAGRRGRHHCRSNPSRRSNYGNPGHSIASFVSDAGVAAGNVLYTDDADTFLTYMKELRGGFDEA